MKILTVNWNPYKDETRVSLSKEFKDSDWVVKADVLADAIDLLTQQYNEILKSL